MDWPFRGNFRRCEAPIPLLAVLDLLECGREPTRSGGKRDFYSLYASSESSVMTFGQKENKIAV